MWVKLLIKQNKGKEILVTQQLAVEIVINVKIGQYQDALMKLNQLERLQNSLLCL